jgi:hypothetical protein
MKVTFGRRKKKSYERLLRLLQLHDASCAFFLFFLRSRFEANEGPRPAEASEEQKNSGCWGSTACGKEQINDFSPAR